jgi:pyridinium-3,5-biscarboxylic acid mononucleotide sulfurtransferase
MTMDPTQGIAALVDYIRALPSTSLPSAMLGAGGAGGAGAPRVLVAFSGGVDSTLVAVAAHRALGARALAVTLHSEVSPSGELETAVRVARAQGLRHRVLEIDWIRQSGAAGNPVDRCYLCKRQLFGMLQAVADQEGGAILLEGSQRDDDGDYRPGLRAIQELGVQSPLKALGFRKADVRACARALGLETADRPALACLATRFPYGDAITREALGRIDRAERALRDLGFDSLRVRHHGEVARLEIPSERLQEAVSQAGEIAALVRGAGYRYVSLDLDGFRSGSMDEGLDLVPDVDPEPDRDPALDPNEVQG